MREINTNDKRFHDGDGRSEMGTIVTADWLNAVQDELVGLVTGFGGEVDRDVKNQIFTLLQAAIGNKANKSEFTSFLDLFIGVPIAIPTATLPVINIPGYTVMALDGGRFSTSMYPKLAKVYPSGVKPDARGEFIRGWDSGRGVDAGRFLLSWQAGSSIPQEANLDADYVVSMSCNDLNNLNMDIPVNDPSKLIRMRTAVLDKSTNFAWTTFSGAMSRNNYSYIGSTRPRNIAFQYICLAA